MLYYNDVRFLKTLDCAWRAFKSLAMQCNADVQFILGTADSPGSTL